MQIRVKRIDHVHLCVPLADLDKAREFYFGLLGFTEIQRPESFKGRNGFWCTHNEGKVQLHIGVDAIIDRTMQHPAFEVENLSEVRKFLESKNVRTNDEPKIPGVERFMFRDPWNNRIEFCERT
jgi:catechol 2,3-dioxygenase-like lactoylglutathione lyase family enzyme